MNLTVSCCSMSSAGPLSGGISDVYACIYVGFTSRRVKVVVLPEYLRMLGNSIAERFTAKIKKKNKKRTYHAKTALEKNKKKIPIS